ncbi:hypothetical protein [Pararhodospirillum photometricum]|nr:hypothetical protein [Pararhodospirillum photometricum]
MKGIVRQGRGLVLALALVGCASSGVPTVPVSVTSYVRPDAPASLKDRAVVVEATAEQKTSLEHAHLRDTLAQEARALGARVVERRQDAAFVLSLYYDMDEGRTTVSQAMTPVSRSFGSPWSPFPTTRWRTETVSETLFTAALTVVVHDARALGDKALEAQAPAAEYHAVRRGDRLALPRIMPALIRAVLQVWPGRDGATRTLSVVLPSGG